MSKNRFLSDSYIHDPWTVDIPVHDGQLPVPFRRGGVVSRNLK